ncbi:MAG: PilZ domain-containing protein [Gammaproteobacteria bacterium]|nr:PilZ domain-containing protein [Gammaproteobacteria bacterium]
MTAQESASERRHYQRIPFIAEVLMEQEEQHWSCRLLDISLKGMLVEPPADVNADTGKTYSIELVLGEDAAIKMQAKISHAEDAHWGLEWENIDLEGLTHLRRLLELNMDNPEEMHRELAELG